MPEPSQPSSSRRRPLGRRRHPTTTAYQAGVCDDDEMQG
jgi:hypothetical protein